MSPHKDTPFSQREIIILGAGIIGCTTARTLLLKGFKVVIIGEHLPGDKDIWYASNWAGALWSGGKNLSSDYHRYLEAVSYRCFLKDALSHPECGVCIIGLNEYFERKPTGGELWFKSVVSSFEDMEVEKFTEKGFEFGCQYETISIEPPRYLPFIKKEIESLGGRFIRKSIDSIEELYKDFPNSKIFINASGNGTRKIKGLIDPNSYPNRGQNVLVKANTDKAYSRNGEEYTYIIPRPLSGVAVCGGVNQENVTDEEVDLTIVKDELKRANKLAPEVIPKDPEIAEIIVGIRPARHDGFRLDMEKVSNDKFILHAYGFNGKGYAFSYGAAHYVQSAVEDLEFDKIKEASA